MKEINQFKLTLKKPLTGKRFYIDRLMKVLGRSFWGVNGVVKDWTEDMLKDALRYCEGYTTPQARNWHFNKYRDDTYEKQ